MIEIEKKLVEILKSDSQLTAIVPASNISVGPPDILIEKQSELRMPMINIFMVSEAVRTVPQGARDSIYQLDIWSRVSQLELEQIYERVLDILNFISYDKDTAHIFWERLSGASDHYETEMRLWHRSMTFTFWGIK